MGQSPTVLTIRNLIRCLHGGSFLKRIHNPARRHTGRIEPPCFFATFNYGWDNLDEKPYNEIEGTPKLTRVKVTKTYHGDIEGESTLEYLMMYRQDETASFVGLERVVGSLGGRSGTFVLQHKGTFEGGKAKVECFVVSGSGTGELSGLRGEGGFAAGHAEQHAVTLDYDFE